MERAQKILIGTAIVFAVLLVAALLKYGGYFDISSDPNLREITFENYTISYTMPWGHTGYRCNAGNLGIVDQVATDTSSNTTGLQIEMTSPNTGSYSCDSYGARGSFTLHNVDPRLVQKMTIHRTTSLAFNARDPSWQSCMLDQCVGGLEQLPGLHQGNFQHSFGDVTVVNNGAGFTINAQEGNKIIATDKPVDISFSASISTNAGSNNYGGYVRMSVTGIDVTFLPGAVPPVVNNSPIVNSTPSSNTSCSALAVVGCTTPPPITNAGDGQEQGFFARIWAWILGIWQRFFP